MLKKIKNYLTSFSTQIGFLMGVLYYISYALPTLKWTDVYLISVSIFIGIFAPYYSKFSNKLDEKACFYTASVFAGKLSRFVLQYLFNIFIFYILAKGTSLNPEEISNVGGIYGLALLISLTSQGMQYLAIALANRDIGTRNFNVTVCICFNILIGAIAAAGVVFVQSILVLCGLIFGILGLVYSLYTDIKGYLAPKGGIGLFFGTFNPPHKTHAKMLKTFIKNRGLKKVIIHPTLIPKVHRLALEKGQIRIKSMQNGMRIYEKTEKADVHANYFLTGNKFYEVDHRINMLKDLIAEEGLSDCVEVLYLPRHYEQDGFYGVIKAIKAKYPNERLHGLHGSDVGGMLVRAIYDESLSIIPAAVKRVDNISATAIRNGAKGMTTTKVQNYIQNLQT